MTKIEPGDVPRQPAGFEVRHDDRGATIVDGEATEVASLDDTAAALWELCDGETDVEEIIAAVCAVWDVEAEVAERDVRRTLRMLRDAGVLEWGAP